MAGGGRGVKAILNEFSLPAKCELMIRSLTRSKAIAAERGLKTRKVDKTSTNFRSTRRIRLVELKLVLVLSTFLVFSPLSAGLINLPGFQPPFRRDRLHGRGGGVAIYVRNGVCVVPVSRCARSENHAILGAAENRPFSKLLSGYE